MKIKSGFILRENIVGNDNKVGVVICVDSSVANLNGYIQLNETGIFIWKMLENGANKQDTWRGRTGRKPPRQILRERN